MTSGHVEPPPAGASVPPWLRRVLLRGLSADPAGRFPGMRQLLLALRDDPGKSRRKLLAGAAALAVASGAGALALRWRRGAMAVKHTRLTFHGQARAPRYSPDGKRLAFMAFDALHVRDLATGAERVLLEQELIDRVEWLPGGVGLAALTRQGFLALPLDGGPARKLEQFGPWSTRGLQAVWSSSSKEIRTSG